MPEHGAGPRNGNDQEWGVYELIDELIPLVLVILLQVQGVLTHEMIHMFDYCRNNLDFKNIDHLACTEIRAANLTHCSFMSSWSQGDSSPINIKATHQDCVKTKALMSVLAVRDVSRDDAIDAVERVFPRCYADLEPIGRRIRRNSPDMKKAYMEGPMYGYDIY